MTHFSIIPDQSRLTATAQSSVHPIHAEATRLTGSIDITLADGALDLSNPPEAMIELRLADLHADNQLYNTELKRRIDARRYPTITGSVTDVQTAPGGGYAVGGDLSLHGVTAHVNGSADLRMEGQELFVNGQLDLDIRNFGLNPPRILMLKVQPAVRVTIDIVAKPG
jgi:polyisoprenoid-binding protein YceI